MQTNLSMVQNRTEPSHCIPATPIEDGAYETRWKQDMSRDQGSMAQEARQAQEAEEHHEKSTEIGGCSRLINRLISGGLMAAVAESVEAWLSDPANQRITF